MNFKKFLVSVLALTLIGAVTGLTQEHGASLKEHEYQLGTTVERNIVNGSASVVIKFNVTKDTEKLYFYGYEISNNGSETIVFQWDFMDILMGKVRSFPVLLEIKPGGSVLFGMWGLGRPTWMKKTARLFVKPKPDPQKTHGLECIAFPIIDVNAWYQVRSNNILFLAPAPENLKDK